MESLTTTLEAANLVVPAPALEAATLVAEPTPVLMTVITLVARCGFGRDIAVVLEASRALAHDEELLTALVLGEQIGRAHV